MTLPALRAELMRARGLAFVVLLASCASHPALGPAPERSTPVIDERLYFGRNIPAGGVVSDSAWSVFLTEVVTPRLPSGFSVYREEGQWRDDQGRIEHEPGFMLEVYHPRGSPPDSVFDAIARIYCARFGQDAVLRTSGPATMKMILGHH